MIWDVHTHLNGVGGRTPDERMAALVRFMDRMSVERVCLMMGYPFLTDPTAEQLRHKNGPMVGVKLWVAKRCSAQELDPIIARATELKAPILQHTWLKATGNLPGESTPQDLVELAGRHPKAALICGHTGGDWELGLRVVRASPSLVVETGGSDPT